MRFVYVEWVTNGRICLCEQLRQAGNFYYGKYDNIVFAGVTCEVREDRQFSQCHTTGHSVVITGHHTRDDRATTE